MTKTDWSLAFSPDSRLLASGSADDQLMLWDASTLFEPGGGSPRLLGRPLINSDRVRHVAFSPDGRLLASAGRNDGAIMLWEISPETWAGRACDMVGRNLTRVEWQRFLGQEPYRLVCPDAPPPPETELQFAVPTPVGTPPLPSVASTGQSDAAVPIIEEFDSTQGFIQTSDNVYIENGQVIWHFEKKGGAQYVYRPIPPFSGNVRLTARGQVDSWTNNCTIEAGIGEQPGVGLGLYFGWTGGGCQTNGVWIDAIGVTLLDKSAKDCNFTGNWLWVEARTPYTAELEILNGEGTLSVEGVGRSSGSVNYKGPYTTLWVGNTGRGDWPECSGTIDRMVVEPLN